MCAAAEATKRDTHWTASAQALPSRSAKNVYAEFYRTTPRRRRRRFPRGEEPQGRCAAVAVAAAVWVWAAECAVAAAEGGRGRGEGDKRDHSSRPFSFLLSFVCPLSSFLSLSLLFLLSFHTHTHTHAHTHTHTHTHTYLHSLSFSPSLSLSFFRCSFLLLFLSLNLSFAFRLLPLSSALPLFLSLPHSRRIPLIPFFFPHLASRPFSLAIERPFLSFPATSLPLSPSFLLRLSPSV